MKTAYGLFLAKGILFKDHLKEWNRIQTEDENNDLILKQMTQDDYDRINKEGIEENNVFIIKGFDILTVEMMSILIKNSKYGFFGFIEVSTDDDYEGISLWKDGNTTLEMYNSKGAIKSMLESMDEKNSEVLAHKVLNLIDRTKAIS